MKSFKIILQQYLEETGYLTPVKLGQNDDKKQLKIPTEERNITLETELKHILKQNKIWGNIIKFIILITLLGWSSWGVLYIINNPSILFMTINSCGMLTFFLILLKRLKNLIKDTTLIDVILTEIKYLPPKEALNIIIPLFRELIKKK